MSQYFDYLMGKYSQIKNWKQIRQYVVVIASPLLLIATVYFWQVSILPDTENKVLSVKAVDQEASTSKNSEKDATEKSIFIDISGAVNKPGIKELAISARVNDAIWSAEGYTVYADKEYIAQVLNLAQPLQDGDKIYIPTYTEVAQSMPDPPILMSKINEPISVVSSVGMPNSNLNSSVDHESDNEVKININSASQAQLDTLPGIGEVNAKKIIDGRPYTSTQEICTKKIVTSSSTCEKIQELITI